MKGKAFLIVRAEVKDAGDRKEFDRWYAQEHLPDAIKAFGAERGWRGWSQIDPEVHIAFYQFADGDKLRAIQGSPALKELIAEFDRAWGDKVARARDMVEVVQGLPA